MSNATLEILEDIVSIKGKEERREILLSDFETGYTQEWFMEIPKSFRSALDIKSTIRMVKDSNGETKPEQVLTQSSNFAFSAGDVLYDTSLAYQIWKEALKNIKVMIQISKASPASTPNKELIFTCEADFKENLDNFEIPSKLKKIFNKTKLPLSDEAIVEFCTTKSDKQSKNNWVIKDDNNPSLKSLRSDLREYPISLKKEKGKEPVLNVHKWTNRISGSISFDIFAPDQKKSKIVKIDSAVMTQDDFVRLVISGNGFRSNYKIH